MQEEKGELVCVHTHTHTEVRAQDRLRMCADFLGEEMAEGEGAGGAVNISKRKSRDTQWLKHYWKAQEVT